LAAVSTSDAPAAHVTQECALEKMRKTVEPALGNSEYFIGVKRRSDDKEPKARISSWLVDNEAGYMTAFFPF
jgi:hypothetical protein